ncbi:methyltransferase N6AMT1 [Aethina tumida]|uniref:methyltransferase N6AMT1 n=1 Tax=Aethina tumida TaxID=116153 RepID=UPI0021492BF1|nr:methyltransferase N6AMT1 [Aethina tumida]
MNLPTPKYNLNDFPTVYEPREDTFLFLDALEKETSYIKKLNPVTVVEIGSGSGVVITSLSHILQHKCVVFATDVNQAACQATKFTAALNHCTVECINMDLLTNFKGKLFDIILFNPPYVVTEDSEIIGTGLSRAWAGGNMGRVIINRLLFKLNEYLSEKGVCYMVLLKENDLDNIVEILASQGFTSEIVLQRKIPGEHLFVYKFYKEWNKSV